MATSTAIQMPRYVCHKKVWALKIKELLFDPGKGAHIIPAEDSYGMFSVDEAYTQRHKPQVGGYYVLYEDDYASFSPAKVFEAGYTKIS